MTRSGIMRHPLRKLLFFTCRYFQLSVFGCLPFYTWFWGLWTSWSTALFSGNIETHISRLRFEWFRRNLARWRSSTLVTRRPLKIPNFENPRWRRPPFWKIQNTKSRPRFKRFLWNLSCWHTATFLTIPTVKIWNFKKSKMAAQEL